MSNRILINLPDKQVQSWDSFNYKGKNYCCRHLDAQKVVYTKPLKTETYDVFITISHHVFSESISNHKPHIQELLYLDKPEDPRHFSLERYGLSLNLFNILNKLPEQFCYHGGHKRYCCCKANDKNGMEINYQIVFKVWKERNKLRLHVESAYPLIHLKKKVQKVSFWVICYNLLNGKKMPSPKL